MNLVKKKKRQNARDLYNDISKERKGKRIECGRKKYRNLFGGEKDKKASISFLWKCKTLSLLRKYGCFRQI